ncbi:hypothetical protein CF319_g7046, partial [Tilletia indica]
MQLNSKLALILCVLIVATPIASSPISINGDDTGIIPRSVAIFGRSEKLNGGHAQGTSENDAGNGKSEGEDNEGKGEDEDDDGEDEDDEEGDKGKVGTVNGNYVKVTFGDKNGNYVGQGTGEGEDENEDEDEGEEGNGEQ